MDKLFLTILNMSLVGTFVIAVVIIARMFLKKTPKIFSYCLWIAVGFRLVFPLSIKSLFSLIPFKAAPIPRDIGAQINPYINSGVKVFDDIIGKALPSGTPTVAINPLQRWINISTCIWIIGLTLMLAYSIVSIIILKRRLSGTSNIFDPTNILDPASSFNMDNLSDTSNPHGEISYTGITNISNTTSPSNISNIPDAFNIGSNVYEAHSIKTPFVIGVFKPKIYIPVGLTEEEKRYVILHERTHVRRKDHIVKIFAYFLLSIHWFNPFVWMAFLLMGGDMEMSCDERVMKELGDNIKNAYSLSLVRMAAGKPILNGSPLAFGEGGIKERVKNILNFKKPARIIILVAILLVAGLTLGLILNRSNEAKHIEKPLPVDKLTISTPRDSYTPFMSSMFGFELEVHAPPEAVKFEYTCDKGSFCTYEDGHIEQIGNNVTTDERVYWRPFEGNSDEYTAVVGTDNTTVAAAEYLRRSKLNGTISIGNTTITVTALDKEDREVAYGIALIENDATGDDKEWFRFKGIVYPSNSEINMEGDREDNGEGEFGRYFTGFTSGLEGWFVGSPGVASSMSKNYVYLTHDSGGTWEEVANVNDEWPRVMTAAAFADPDIGYLCFRYDIENVGRIYQTKDGGRTWNKFEIPGFSDLVKDGVGEIRYMEFDGYGKGKMEVYFRNESNEIDEGLTFIFVSENKGQTWVLLPENGIVLSESEESRDEGFQDEGPQDEGVQDKGAQSEGIQDKGAQSEGVQHEWILIDSGDLNSDGEDEYIYLDKSLMHEDLVKLIVANERGNKLWDKDFFKAHAGWGQLFFYNLDGSQYLLSYDPYMSQGYAAYTYTLFSLEDGNEKILQTDTLEFDVNGVKELNVPKMLSFAEEINALLEKSTLLISSEGGEFHFGPGTTDPYYENYSWLNVYPNLYEKGDTLETKLKKYSDYMTADPVDIK